MLTLVYPTDHERHFTKVDAIANKDLIVGASVYDWATKTLYKSHGHNRICGFALSSRLTWGGTSDDVPRSPIQPAHPSCLTLYADSYAHLAHFESKAHFGDDQIRVSDHPLCTCFSLLATGDY